MCHAWLNEQFPSVIIILNSLVPSGTSFASQWGGIHYNGKMFRAYAGPVPHNALGEIPTSPIWINRARVPLMMDSFYSVSGTNYTNRPFCAPHTKGSDPRKSQLSLLYTDGSCEMVYLRILKP